MKRKLPRNKGFTLIELMVVIAIIGILSAVLVPSYLSFVRRSNASANEQELLQVKQIMDTAILAGDTYSISLTPTEPATDIYFDDLNQFVDSHIVKQFYLQETGEELDGDLVIYVENDIMYYVYRGLETRYDLVSQNFLNYTNPA
jgi:prepilin-type N-terminal cleavage/methylation domain-containing protein